jgi:hypothetical protein
MGSNASKKQIVQSLLRNLVFSTQKVGTFGLMIMTAGIASSSVVNRHHSTLTSSRIWSPQRAKQKERKPPGMYLRGVPKSETMC